MKSGDEWLSVGEVAELKGVPADTVRRRIQRERLPAIKKSGVWLIRRKDADAWQRKAKESE
jgi:excisionase family DNA binding protein